MRFLKFFLVFVCLVLLLTLSQQANAGRKKAKSIDELAARYDVSSCKDCHEEIYEQWEKSMHSRSLFGTGRTAATIRTTITEGLMKWPYSGVKKSKKSKKGALPFKLKTIKVKHFMMCAKCHLPQLSEATDDVIQEIIKAAFIKVRTKADFDKQRKILSKLNINCLICHRRNAIVHKWLDGYPEKEKGVLYGTRDVEEHEDEVYTTVKKNPIMGESIFCGQCHGLGPNFELEEPSQCASAYASYLFNYITGGGSETCQSCHMRKFDKGHLMPAYRDKDMGKVAVELDVNASSYPAHKLAMVDVKMINKTGHNIPDG